MICLTLKALKGPTWLLCVYLETGLSGCIISADLDTCMLISLVSDWSSTGQWLVIQWSRLPGNTYYWQAGSETGLDSGRSEAKLDWHGRNTDEAMNGLKRCTTWAVVLHGLWSYMSCARLWTLMGARMWVQGLWSSGVVRCMSCGVHGLQQNHQKESNATSWNHVHVFCP